MGHVWSKNTTTTQKGSSGAPNLDSVRLSAGRGEQLRIILSNQSSYDVSYLVIQEKKQKFRSRSSRTTMPINVGAHAGIFTGVGGTGEVVMEREQTANQLSIYVRMKPLGRTNNAEVLFLEGCQELRVYASFLDKDGHWQPYKEKVYSIGQNRKQNILLTALDSNIEADRNCRSDSAVADGDDGAASSGKGTVVAGGLGGRTLPASEWSDVSICGQSLDVSPSGNTVVFDLLRDVFGFVEVKVAHEESALMINVKLVDRVYTEEILVRGERDTYFIDPVVKGPHGVEFAKASIRYFVGRYNGLLVRFDRNRERTPDKENEKSGIGSLAVQQYFPVHKPDRSEDNVNPPWEPYGEFKAVWDGDALWLEAPLTHFSCIGKAFRQLRRKLRGVTPPLSPARGVENAMESGLIQAAEDVVPSRLIRLTNNTKQTMRTCVTPDASPNQQATKKTAAGVGLNVLSNGGDARRSRHASHQHGAMGGAGNASLGAQHNTLGPGQSTKDPLGGHGDGGLVWYTANEFTPNDLESRQFDPAPPLAGNATPSPTQTQAGHTPSAQAQVQPEHPLVCGFSLARLEEEHGYVVDQRSQTFVRKSTSLFAWTGRETFRWLIIIRIRHNSRISPGMYCQMNEAKLTQERVQDFVLRPGENVNEKVNQYVKANLV